MHDIILNTNLIINIQRWRVLTFDMKKQTNNGLDIWINKSSLFIAYM